MDALTAASLTPISVLCDRRTTGLKKSTNFSPNQPKFSALCTKTQNLKTLLPGCFHGSLILLSSVLGNNNLAKALTYEEALQQSPSSDVDFTGILDSVIKFGTENPVIVAGSAAVLGVPLIVSQILNSKPYRVESAKTVYAKLGEEANAQLIDIRPAAEIRQVGTPDIKGLGKKSVAVAYKSEDKNGFLKKLSLRFKEPGNITLFILDNSMSLKKSTSSECLNLNYVPLANLCSVEKMVGVSDEARFDGNSELVAELVTQNGFKAAYAIKDGAEGPRGWLNSGLPWAEPKKGLTLDLNSLTESFSGALGDGSDGLPVALGLALATGLGALAFSEVETILQLFGSLAIIQFASKKLLFAEDRKQTLKQVDEFLNTKIAPKELADEIKEIGQAILPSAVTNIALPANPEPTPTTTQKVEAPPINSVPAAEVKAESPPPATEIKAESPPPVAAPVAEVKAESPSPTPRSLSPYPSYPDLKPPTSPTPSKP
ncbi:hypothetical protein ACFE04_016290 [Oxalis oulophora]